MACTEVSCCVSNQRNECDNIFLYLPQELISVCVDSDFLNVPGP
jgi:hypothetical protein